MKRLLLLLALTLPILAKAQTTALPLPTDGSTWVIYDGFQFPPETTQGRSLLPFDVIGGTYDLSVAAIPDCGSEWQGVMTSENYSQIGNKWYCNGQLFFDWDIQVGDTLNTEITGDFIHCLISSIETVVYSDLVPRRVYHLAYETGTTVYYPSIFHELLFIEGIGTNALGLGYANVESIPLLICFYDKYDNLIFTNDWQDFAPSAPVSCCPIFVEETTAPSFKLFPSPATDHTSIQFEAAHIPQSIQIFNATGQLMHTEKVLGRLQMQVNVSEYAKGIYTVRGRFENGEEVSEKLVVE
jgi:hypothetical protein